jgi:uncharacterized protein (TIGR04222 family)
MNQPWGLSGPQFLGVYAAGLAAVFVIALLTRQLVRRLPAGPGPAAAGDLNLYQAAYLAGGPHRAAQVMVAELTQAGALRVSSAGNIMLADAGLAAASPPAALYGVRIDRLPSGTQTKSVLRALARDPGVTGIGHQLAGAGLTVGKGRRRAARAVTGLAAIALFVTAIARFMEAAANHRPAGNLGGLFVLSLIVCLFLVLATAPPSLRTPRGARCLRQLQRDNRDADSVPVTAPGWAVGAPYYQDQGPNGFGPPGFGPPGVAGTALLGVALLGFSAVADTQLRDALLAGMPSSSSGGSDGGGSSCGGGGCGGGCGG